MNAKSKRLLGYSLLAAGAAAVGYYALVASKKPGSQLAAGTMVGSPAVGVNPYLWNIIYYAGEKDTRGVPNLAWRLP